MKTYPKDPFFTRGVSTIMVVLVIVLLVGLAWLIFGGERGAEDDAGAIEWRTYTNEEFGFAIEHPADWRVAEFPDDRIQPVFNIYPEGAAGSPPFTHHHDAVNVSVFPHGVPTEGVFGEQTDSEVEFRENVVNARDYVLEGGERWATTANFASPPASWREAGFIWARAAIEDESVSCLRDGEKVSEEQCDPMFGDTIVREGEVERDIRAVQTRMLESFRFIDAGEGESSGREVLLYYYNPQKDTDAEGNIMCSKEGLAAVERTISPTSVSLIQDTIRMLIRGNLRADEAAGGVETEFPLSGFSLTGASLNEGSLTLSFSDPQNSTSGGSCRAGILWHQIEQTALQFDAVKEVRFRPETLFQP